MKTDSRFNVILFIVTLTLFAPTWLWLGEAWLSDPYYSHGPLVVIVAVYFAWVQRKSLTMPRTIISSPSASLRMNLARNLVIRFKERDFSVALLPQNYIGFLLLAIALAVHLWATLWRAYYISALMIPLTLLGLLITLFGCQVARRFLFPLSFMILMVPLPLAERFGPALESFTAASATTLAQFTGVSAHNEGSQVFLPNSTFTVGIPCGGLRSVIAIITLTMLFAYILHGRLWARVALFFAAIPIALAANTIRIALLFAIANAWSAEAALDYFHDWSSPVLFACAFGLIIVLAKFLRASEVRWEAVLPQ